MRMIAARMPRYVNPAWAERRARIGLPGGERRAVRRLILCTAVYVLDAGMIRIVRLHHRPAVGELGIGIDGQGAYVALVRQRRERVGILAEISVVLVDGLAQDRAVAPQPRRPAVREDDGAAPGPRDPA